MFDHVCYFNQLGSNDTFYKVLVSGTREIGIVSTLHKKIIGPALKKYYKTDYKLYVKVRRFFPHENDQVESSNKVHFQMCGRPLFKILNDEPITLKQYFELIGWDHSKRKLNGQTITQRLKEIRNST